MKRDTREILASDTARDTRPEELAPCPFPDYINGPMDVPTRLKNNEFKNIEKPLKDKESSTTTRLACHLHLLI